MGLHCHICTSDKQPESYAEMTKAMLSLTDEYLASRSLKFIDLGGGFFSRMDERLKQQFSCHIATFQDYASAIAPYFSKKYSDASGPELILEPGLALTADTMQFCAKVIDIKRVGDRFVMLVSGSVYEIKPTLSPKNLPMHIVSQSQSARPLAQTGVFDVVGYTCMENDVLYRGFEGTVAVGDYAIFNNVGSYTLVLSPSFIRPNPPVIMYDAASDKSEVLKRRECLGDVFTSYL